MYGKNIHSDKALLKQNEYYKEKAKKVYKKRVYYLFITIILIVCLIQTFRGAYLNIAKYFTLDKKIYKLEQLNALAKDKNTELKKQLKEFTSSKGIEALARDNFKMVGNGEVLVVIKQSRSGSNKE